MYKRLCSKYVDMQRAAKQIPQYRHRDVVLDWKYR